MARKNDWSKQELESSVIVYLEMLHKQENGEPFVKKESSNSSIQAMIIKAATRKIAARGCCIIILPAASLVFLILGNWPGYIPM